MLHIDREAAEAIAAIGRTVPDAVVRMEISSGFHHELYFGDPSPDDVVAESSGVRVHLDLASSRRAEGLRIAHVKGAGGRAFASTTPTSLRG